MGFNVVSFRSRLYNNDRTWAWKFAVRVLSIVVALIAVGCIGGVMGQIDGGGISSYYYSFSYFWVPWDLIPVGLSIVWNAANVTVLLMRKRSIHPGANVGCDLILWLALLVTGLFLSFTAVVTVNTARYNQTVNSVPKTSPRHYANGTIYVPSGYAYNSTGYYSDGRPVCGFADHFVDCAEQEAQIHRKQQQGTLEAIASAITFTLLLFHFALFISACRATHARRRDAATRRAKEILLETNPRCPSPPQYSSPPPVPQIRENGQPVPESGLEAVSATEDYPQPLTMQRIELGSYPLPLKANGNSWAVSGRSA